MRECGRYAIKVLKDVWKSRVYGWYLGLLRHTGHSDQDNLLTLTSGQKIPPLGKMKSNIES